MARNDAWSPWPRRYVFLWDMWLLWRQFLAQKGESEMTIESGERPICARCGGRILKAHAFTYDADKGVFSHWLNASVCGGAHSAGPVNTPGTAGATPATSKPIHSKNCWCIRCKPSPVVPTEPEPEILPIEEKA